MNWFKRHLNWTVIFALVVTYPFVTVWFKITASFGFPDPSKSDISTSLLLAWWSILIVSLAIRYGVAGWALRQKQRSLFWLIIIWAVLFLENRSAKRLKSGGG